MITEISYRIDLLDNPVQVHLIRGKREYAVLLDGKPRPFALTKIRHNASKAFNAAAKNARLHDRPRTRKGNSPARRDIKYGERST